MELVSEIVAVLALLIVELEILAFLLLLGYFLLVADSHIDHTGGEVENGSDDHVDYDETAESVFLFDCDVLPEEFGWFWGSFYEESLDARFDAGFLFTFEVFKQKIQTSLDLSFLIPLNNLMSMVLITESDQRLTREL